MKRKPTREEVAANVANKLFVNGIGEEAIRLMLISADGRDLGGWCKDAVRDLVLRELDAAKKSSMSIRAIENRAWNAVKGPILAKKPSRKEKR